MLDFDLYFAISFQNLTLKTAKKSVLKMETSALFERFPDHPLSPFETACYFGNVVILNDILSKAIDFCIPQQQLNAGFSHAIWQNKTTILTYLLERYPYTFDQVEFERVQLSMKHDDALTKKINALTQNDFNHAKSLALLFHEFHHNYDVSKLLTEYLPSTHEGRRTEILNAHRSFIAKLEEPNHDNDLQAYREREETRGPN